MILYRTVRFYGIYVQYNKLKITQVSVLDSLQLEVDDLLEDHLRQGAGLEVSVLDSLVLEVDDLLKDHLRQGAGLEVSVLDSLVLEVDDLLEDHLLQGAGLARGRCAG